MGALRSFGGPTRADERAFEHELAMKCGTRRQTPQTEETWVGVAPDTEGVRFTVISVHADEPVPYAEVFSRQLGRGLVRMAVFGRYFERQD